MSLTTLPFDCKTASRTVRQTGNPIEVEATTLDREVRTSMVAHELLTPLAAMQLLVDRTRRLAPKLPDAAEHELTVIIARLSASVQRLTGLVDDLLDDASHVHNVFRLELQRMSLSETLHALCEELRPLALQHKFELVDNVPDGIWGQWDRRRIEQIVTNLITNALRHGRSPIVVSATADDQGARVFVHDHGPGIPKSMEHHIFGRFVRGTLGGGGRLGLGLGLAISRQLAEAHRGQLCLTSPPDGQGANFCLTLPRMA